MSSDLAPDLEMLVSMKTRQVLAWFLIAAGVFGCARSEQAALVTVEGKVVFDGQPLTTGTVIFRPNAARGNTSNEEPRGSIQPDGSYRLSTQSAEEGVAPGWYKVGVIAQKKFDWITPTKYANPDTSGIAREVVENAAAGAYDIELNSKR